jgi:Fe-S oxidoreductase
MFTKEARLQAALEGKLPEYIMTLVANCLETGNAYGKTSLCDTLKEKISAYAKKTDTLLFLGVDARYAACNEALKAIKVLEKAEVEFSLVENEAASGAQLDFLIGAANETKAQAEACAKLLNEYKTVVVYDPNDAKMIKQIYKELGVEVGASVVTFTTYVAELLKNGKLKANKSDNTVVFQDPYQLSRDLGETEPAREIIKAYANLEEMLLNRDQTVWAGNILMAQYMPEIIKKVSARRLLNVKSIGQSKIVTACVSEYVALKSVATDVEVLSIEDLILA